MQKKTILGLITGLLILTLFALPLLTACEEEEGPPGEEEEEEVNWWDEFGEPQYGGTITIPIATHVVNLDTYSFQMAEINLWYETLFEPDWTLDRETWSMTTMYIPDQYWVGNLAESWEIPDAQTIIVHLRQGIKWQDKPPVNGREFTAYDVQEHFHRAIGLGSYTEGSPEYVGMFAAYESVTATGDYTVEFKFKTPGSQYFQSLTDRASFNMIEAPEWVALSEEERLDWHNAVGTGPWMLDDLLQGSSLTFSANPDYWGTDPRHPENQVPYADELVLLVIPDASARIAAMRSGQVDVLASSGTNLTWQEAQTLADTNPEIVMKEIPNGSSGLTMKVTEAPFTDIRVRQALNMALNREEINIGYYGGTGAGVPCGLITTSYTGYAFDYEDWPQELKDQYAYNPEGARQLLAEAAADGVFTPNDLGGFDTNTIASTSGDIQLLEVIQSYFLDIGVDMEIRTMDFASYEAFRRESQHDQMVTAYGAFTWPPSRSIGKMYSKGMDNCDNMINDPVYDSLYDQYFATLDADEAASILVELDRRVIEMHWLVTAGEYYVFVAWQPYLKGYSGEPFYWGGGIAFSRLWIGD